jgi:hypothetical protein
MDSSASPSEQPVACLNELIASLRGKPFAGNERCYLLVDGARLKQVSDILRKRQADEWINLLGASLDTPLMEVSPILISLGNNDVLAGRMLKQPKYRGTATLIVSTATLSELAENLKRHLYVEEGDGTRWMLAFWDPFVLPSLIVDAACVNPLVPGPVLDSEQVGSLMATISCVAFQNREGELQGINLPPSQSRATLPFILQQAQIDQLMDVPLPGQVAETLMALEDGNAPNETLLNNLCCEAIQNARREGRDTLADYCATALDMLSEQITTENKPI